MSPLEPWTTAPTAAALRGIQTPALVVDRDRLRRNVASMATRVAARGLALRPHAKTHKCVEIARLQVGAGAVGLTVATLAEAEAFAAAGFDDVFVAYPVVPVGARAEQLRRLLDRTRLSVGVDNAVGARAVAEAAAGRTVPVLVEVDSGQHRTGVDPADVVPLARECRTLGLRVVGVFTHGGHAYASRDAPPSAAVDEGAALAAAARQLRRAGFETTVASAGSTPTSGTPRPEEVTEERPGTYVFGDRQQLALGGCTTADLALSVATTVVSVRHGRFVVDAGSKALAGDRPAWLDGHGWVPEVGGLVSAISEHHGTVEGATRLPKVGDVVRVVPNHACTAVNLFDEYLVVSGGEVVDRWPVAARGS